MDDRRFDALTRSLASGIPRRKLFKALLGGLVGGAAVAGTVRETRAATFGEVCSTSGEPACDEGTGLQCLETEGPTTCQCVVPNQWCAVLGMCILDTVCCPDCGSTCCTGEQKCCNGVCIPSNLCCAEPDDCTLGFCCATGQLCSECCEHDHCEGECSACHQGDCSDDSSLCEDDCDICSAGTCHRACVDPPVCCISGPPEDVSIVCVEECCDNDPCGDCRSCLEGVCIPDVIPCGDEEQACCVQGQLVCAECCGHADCDECEVCFNGSCIMDEECCPRFGEVCGQIAMIAEGGSPQLDCCEGLVCCDGDPPVCAECCGDRDCPKDQCCCKDGTCSHKCCEEPPCKHDTDCPKDQCCCKDGTCSHKCCNEPPCKHDKDCPMGTCCCKDGSCSQSCCETSRTPPPIDTFPNTGSGPSGAASDALGIAALGAAAYLTGRTLRQQGNAPETASSEG